MSSDPVLVVGAAGRVAPAVVHALVRRGAHVRGLVPRPELIDDARRHGCTEVVVADLRDAEQVAAAVSGCASVFHIGAQFAVDEAALGITVARAATCAGVGRVVFSSVVRPDNGLANHAAKLPVQRALYHSGLPFTILQPVTLMQNLNDVWPDVVRTGEFAEPFGVDIAIARVDYRDVAEIAATALTTDRFAGATLELAAETHDRRAVAELMSRVLGRPVVARAPSWDEWSAGHGVPRDVHVREQLAAVMADYAEHGSPGDPTVLGAALGRPPRTLEAYLGWRADGVAG